MKPLEQFVEDVSKYVSAAFDKHGFMTPVYFFIDRAGRQGMFPSPPVGDPDFAALIVRKLLADLDVVRVALADEAWTAEIRTTDPEEVKRLYMQGARCQPNRQEVLMIQAEDAIEGELTAHRIITRKDGKPVLGELKIEKYSRSEGRVVGLLPARGKPN